MHIKVCMDGHPWTDRGGRRNSLTACQLNLLRADSRAQISFVNVALRIASNVLCLFGPPGFTRQIIWKFVLAQKQIGCQDQAHVMVGSQDVSHAWITKRVGFEITHN